MKAPRPDYPNRTGTRKPASAARHIPAEHVAMATCPTCKGSGKVPKDEPLARTAMRFA